MSRHQKNIKHTGFIKMSRKRCNRKVWSTSIDTITHAITGAAITDSVALNKVRMLELSAIDNFVNGRASLQDWRAVVDMLNICEMMAKSGIGPEAIPHCEQATQSLHNAAMRYEKTKKMGLDGLGLTAIKEVHEYHDLQRTSISRSEYEKMIKKTADYIKSKGKEVTVIT